MVEIWHLSKRTAYPYVEVQQSCTIDDDSAYFQEAILNDCQVRVAEDEDQILGFMAIDGDLIGQLFMKVGEQQRGIGSLQVGKAKALSPKGLRAYMFQKNSAARSFFEKQGFEIVGSGLSPAPENEPDLEYAWKP